MKRTEIILIDSDVHRRAQMAHALTDMVAFVLPLEHYSEIAQCWPNEAIVLIEDKGDAIDCFQNMMKLHHQQLPFIAFSTHADAADKAAASEKGAKDYLCRPCTMEDIRQSIHAVVSDMRGRQMVRLLGGGLPSSFPQMSEMLDAGVAASWTTALENVG